MKKITPRQAADRLVAGANAAQSKIREGIEGVTTSPTASAADNIQKMLQRLLDAFNDGRVEAGLRRVTLEEWKAAALEGVSRIPTGLERNRAKIEAFFAELLPYQESYTAEIDRMPNLTIEDSRARMNANFDRMVDFGKRRRGGR